MLLFGSLSAPVRVIAWKELSSKWYVALQCSILQWCALTCCVVANLCSLCSSSLTFVSVNLCFCDVHRFRSCLTSAARRHAVLVNCLTIGSRTDSSTFYLVCLFICVMSVYALFPGAAFVFFPPLLHRCQKHYVFGWERCVSVIVCVLYFL